MHSAYLFLAIAAAAQGLPFTSRVSTLAESLFTRDIQPDGPRQSWICPKSTDQQPDAVTKKPINATELAFAQQQLLSYCDTGVEIPPATGGQGHIKVFRNASV
jgi:hypothetical protein